MQPGYPNVSIVPTPLLINGVPILPSSPRDLLSAPLIPFEYIPAPYQPQVAPLYGLMSLPLSPEHHEYYKNYGDNKAYELFADGTYDITEQLSITAGVRFSIEKISSSCEAGGDNKAHLGFARNAGSNLLFMPTEKISEEDTFKSWVGRLALNYALTEDWELYASVAKGRRPNVIQFISTPNNDGSYTSNYNIQTLNDEIVKSYELGLKGLTLGNHLYFDIAAFYYDYTDFQTSTVDENSLLIIYKDAGDATAYGAETSLQWQINKGVSLFGNYAYINAEFADEDSEGNQQSLSGNTFRLTPEHSFTLGTHMSWKINNNFNLFLRPVYKYKSKVFFEETNLEVESQDGYGLLNGRVGFEMPENKLTVTFFMNNILNEEYLIDAGNTGRNFGIPTFIAGAPRMWGIELNVKL
ncbi:TonB-dependent receptor [Balneicella halophila]|uniref:TonB-dependent receptor n=1 Tax=Balneicella halophila TaxID=1537566 RepID=UPI001A9CA02E|nr:TonB-dependent receptor [Balneicella halophila]